jgi:Phage virion morphogenesis family
VTVTITADVAGAIRANQAMLDRLNDLTPALKVGAEILATAIDDRFATSTDFRGAAFAPNAPSTVAKKGSAKKGSAKPDIDKGTLRRSIVVRVDGKDTIRFGTNVPYAAPVAFGSHRSGTLKGDSREHLGQLGGRVRRTGAKLGVARQTRSKATPFQGPRRTRAAGTAWAVDTPSRNFFPVDASGMWVDAGAAKALLDKITNLIGRYVATGSLT